MKRVAHILVVSRDASLRDGMVTLLSSIPEIVEISQARNRFEALQSIEANTPQLVIVDLVEGRLEVLHEIQIRWPRVKTLLLVEGMHQQTQSQVAGADVALIKGYPAQELIETVQALLLARNGWN